MKDLICIFAAAFNNGFLFIPRVLSTLTYWTYPHTKITLHDTWNVNNCDFITEYNWISNEKSEKRRLCCGYKHRSSQSFKYEINRYIPSAEFGLVAQIQSTNFIYSVNWLRSWKKVDGPLDEIK